MTVLASGTMAAATGHGVDSDPVRVPVRRLGATPVLLNGHFGTNEWDEVSALNVDVRTRIMLSQDREYVYVGIRFFSEGHTGIDLYVAGVGETRKKLYVSAAIGEAGYASGTWGDIQWGGNVLWSANAVNLIVEDGRQKTVPLEGFEFQIARTLAAGWSWRLLFHMKRPERKYPAGASTESTAGWLRIEL